MRGKTQARRTRAKMRRRPAPMAFHFRFAVDTLEVHAKEVVQHTRAPQAAIEPDQPDTWRRRMLGWGQKLWPVATAAGSALVFLLGRVGIGLRGEDLVWLFRPGLLSRD